MRVTRALCLAAFGWAANASANTSNGYNLPRGVTDLAQDMYGLHMLVFWICVGIAVVVFGAMIYALIKFRHSKGAVPDVNMIHSTEVEIIWTIIPVIILVVMAIPAAELILKQEDTRNSQLSIRVTAYQWKWEYAYMDSAEGVDFFSTLARDSNFARQKQSGIDPHLGKIGRDHMVRPLVAALIGGSDRRGRNRRVRRRDGRRDRARCPA